MIRLPAVPLVLLSLAAAAPAQLTETQANAQLKAVLKQAKKDHAASMTQRVKAATAGIDAFVAAVPNGAGAAFADLFDTLESFQIGLLEDFRVFQSSAAQDAVDLLGEFAGPTDLLGVYPDAYYEGAHGALDGLRAAMDAAQVKALAKVRKKLDKAAAKLAKTSTVRISAFLEPAVHQGSNSFIQDSITAYNRDPLVIHTVLALGFTDSVDSGTVLAAGMGDDAQPFSVSAVNEGVLQNVEAEFFELGSPYWHVTIDNEGQGMPDGNVLVFAEQGAFGTSFGAYVSVK